MTDSTESRFAQLQAELGARPPDALAALSDAELGDLTAALSEDRRRRAWLLDAALDRAFAPLPRRIRKSLKRIVRG